MSSLAQSLAEGLCEAKDYFNAASVYADYMDDTETAARIFCKGYHFSEAMRLVALTGQSRLLSTVIDQGLTECLASSTELLADCKAQLMAQVPRLREIRNKMKEDPRNVLLSTSRCRKLICCSVIL
jgi:elongator complex protein 1